MALWFSDGCDNGVSTAIWTNISGTVTHDPVGGVRANTGAVSFPAAAFGTNQVHKLYKETSVGGRADTDNGVFRTSLWFKCNQTITTEAIFLNWREYFYPDNAVVAIGTDGKLKISNWYPFSTPANRVYYTTTMSRIDDGSWHHLEFAQYYIGTTAGLIEVYVDGLQALRRTGANLGTGTVAPTLVGRLYVGGLINGTMYIDDLVVWDDRATPNSYVGRKGPITIYTVRPNTDTSWANSTPSSGGDRYSMINEESINFANLVNVPINTMDVFNFTKIPEVGISGQVYAITPSVVFSSSQPGYTSNLKIMYTQNDSTFTKGSNTFSAFSANIANGYTYRSTFVSDSWSANSINMMKFGYEVLP